MGTDITLHIEVKLFATWDHFAQLNPKRCYPLFDKMAGVRGEGKAIVEPRGIPYDATALTKHACKGHTAGYLLPHEIEWITEWYDTECPNKYYYLQHFEQWLGVYFYGNSFHRSSWPSFIKDLRFVFSFDC